MTIPFGSDQGTVIRFEVVRKWGRSVMVRERVDSLAAWSTLSWRGRPMWPRIQIKVTDDWIKGSGGRCEYVGLVGCWSRDFVRIGEQDMNTKILFFFRRVTTRRPKSQSMHT